MSKRAQLEPGTLIEDRYRIAERIGQGGMGAVYLAEDTRFDCDVALKLTVAAGAVYEGTKARFFREARLGNTLGRAPGIVRVLDHGELAGGALFLVMDLVKDARALELEGGTLEQRLDRLEEAAQVVARVHAQGIVHRDLKPDNLMRDAEGQLWLADFGLAKRLDEDGPDEESAPGLTMTGIGMGTPYFMPPEQFEDAASAGLPADVYALGTMLFLCLARILPFRGKSSSQILKEQIRIQIGQLRPPRPRDFDPAVSPELEAVCLRAMDMDPARRHPDATRFLESLRQARGQAPLEPPQPKVLSLTEGRQIRRRLARPPAKPSLAKRPGRHSSSGGHAVLASSGERPPASSAPQRSTKRGVAIASFVIACVLIGAGVYAHERGYLELIAPTPQALADQAEALYRRGQPADAAPLYERAALAGHVESMISAGDLYAAGEGVPLDPERAIKWWRQAAAKGSATAKLRLSNLGVE